MRYHQLVFESTYIQELKDDIINLLSMSKSQGISKIRTPMLINDLKSIGYDIDENSILPLLDEIEIVSSSDNKFVEINGSGENIDNTDDDMEIPKLDQEPLDDMNLDTKDDVVDRLARKRSVGDL